MSGPRWFVMLNRGDGNPAPLVEEDESVALFADEGAAEKAGFSNPFGDAFGFEVCEWTFKAPVQEVDRGA